MFFTSSGWLRRLALATILLSGCVFMASVRALERSDILLDIVSNCVDLAPANYCTRCRLPRSDAGCGAAHACKKSTEVWALNDQYTVIRDIKMCGCPSDFVHGLALPTYPISGVEDANLPEGIWQYAWDAAIARIEPESIVLVVNPRSHRSQNQLHVHILRLTLDARERLEKETPTYVSSLDHIWATAVISAASKGLVDYGVLVSQRRQGDFFVVVTDDSPEDAFTKWRCD